MEKKKEELLTLAIESSCDETSAAVLRGGREILANIISTQIPIHQKFGGVVPEIASRKHIVNIMPVIDECLRTAGVELKDIDQVVLVGRCSAANDIKARVWTRLDDYSTSPVETSWSYVDNSGKDLYALGSIRALAVTAYEGVPYALKSDGSEVSALLCSLDGGLSWKDSGLTVPSGMTATNGNLAMTVDKDGRMWIIADGKVWKN